MMEWFYSRGRAKVTHKRRNCNLLIKVPKFYDLRNYAHQPRCARARLRMDVTS